MASLGFAAPQNSLNITFSAAPIHNVLYSFCLLQQNISGLMPWVENTVNALDSEELRWNKLYCGAFRYTQNTESTTFDAWLEELAQTDPQSIVENEFKEVLAEFREYSPERTDFPSVEEVHQNKQLFLEMTEKVHKELGRDYDAEFYGDAWEALQHPEEFLSNMVRHLRTMWNRFLAPEWPSLEKRINESVKAFQSLDLNGMGNEETLKLIVERETLPDGWLEMAEKARELIYVPNPHIGPYLMMYENDDNRLYIAGQARIPKGAKVESTPLSRSELMVRLTALSDDSRLGILKLASEKEEITTTDVMQELSLSQSSASRHLTQLAATGFLKTRSQERTKYYRLSRSRIEDTVTALKAFLF